MKEKIIKLLEFAYDTISFILTAAILLGGCVVSPIYFITQSMNRPEPTPTPTPSKNVTRVSETWVWVDVHGGLYHSEENCGDDEKFGASISDAKSWNLFSCGDCWHGSDSLIPINEPTPTVDKRGIELERFG